MTTPGRACALALALARGSWLPTIRGTLFTVNFIDSLLYSRSERLFPRAGTARYFQFMF